MNLVRHAWLLVLFACVSRPGAVTTTTSAESDGSTAGTTAEPAPTGTDSGETAGTTTGAPPDLPALCDDYRDDAPGDDLAIRIHNNAAVDMFLESDCQQHRWYVDPAGVDPAIGYPPPLLCATASCESKLGVGCRQRFCPLPCPRVPPVRIVPGGTFTVQWPQLLREAVALPVECGGCETCALVRRSEAGEAVDLRLYVTDILPCANEMEACTCVPDDEGACELPDDDGGVPGSTVFTFAVDADGADILLVP